MAQELTYSISIETDYRDPKWLEQEKVQLEALRQQFKKQHTGELVGEILRWQRADGYAQYMVISEKPFKIVHLDIGDGYCVEPALIRGLRLIDAREMVERARRWERMFSTKG